MIGYVVLQILCRQSRRSPLPPNSILSDRDHHICQRSNKIYCGVSQPVDCCQIQSLHFVFVDPDQPVKLTRVAANLLAIRNFCGAQA